MSDRSILYVVPCSARKSAALQAGPCRSGEAYAGQAFQISKRLLQAAGARWCIFSAYYGFLYPDTMIDYYEQKLTRERITDSWFFGFDYINQKQYGRLFSASQVVVLGSTLYSDAVSHFLCRKVLRPVAGLPIGKMLQRLSAGTWINPREERAA